MSSDMPTYAELQAENAVLRSVKTELQDAAVAALEDVMSIDNEHSLSPDVGRKLRAAIDKATGAMP
ncbi:MULTISPECIES: hypothetical protein [Delftia]|uniref:hypothetical protein n=1 Tax=Delftia TaxID=80865 RepID=UPI000F81C40E|nr:MULTISPECIES: hypothetical protein [Delftia]WEM00063.1 hypothetical protein PW274_07195 [Delftia tsuruhatensis]